MVDKQFINKKAARKATFSDLRNLMRNFSTFSLALFILFTVHRCTKLFGPKVK